MVLGAHGTDVRLAELRDLTSTGRDGVSAAGLVLAAEQFGLHGVGVRCPLERVNDLPRGAILHWGGNHFVVLEGHSRRGLRVLDPALGRRVVAPATVAEQYSGVAVLFEPDGSSGEHAVATDRPRRISSQRYRPFFSGTRRPAVLALLFAAAVQLFTLVHPVVLRTVVGAVQQPGRALEAPVLALAVAALGVGFLGAYVGRLLFLLAIERIVDVRMTVGVLDHLASLPYAFVARRSTGDLALRVRSTVAVRQILTTSALSAVLDGLLVLGYLALILRIDTQFALLTGTAIGLQGLIVAVTWHRLRQTAAEALEAQSGAQARLIEIVSSLELLKASGAARQAVKDWSPHVRREVAAQAASSRASGLVDSVLLAIRFMAPPALLVLGLARVASGDLTLANMLALAALAAAITIPTGALLSTVCSLTAVSGYLERIDDLLQAPIEAGGGAAVPQRLEGAATLRDVSYTYSALLPPAVEQITLDIAPGEHVAVVGASGSGKTTLAMLIATLYDPTSGEIRLDGIDPRDVDRDALRRRIGLVTQNTTLFNASIKDNIVFGRPEVTDADIEYACRTAAIHDDIVALPSGYETILGNGGTGLSGGQRQRLAIARALAARPGLLVLDEATSALDTMTEGTVHQGIDELQCTRIVVAHRFATIKRAERVLVMAGGRIVADGSYASVRRRSPEFRELVAAESPSRPRAVSAAKD